MINKNEKEQSAFQKILYNQVSLIIASVGLAFSVYFIFANPQKQTEQILAATKAEFNTHEALQEQYQEKVAYELKLVREGDLKDLKADLIENRNEIVSLQHEITKLQTIIEERIPAKK